MQAFYRRHQGAGAAQGRAPEDCLDPAVDRPDHRRDRVDRPREAGLRQRAGRDRGRRWRWSGAYRRRSVAVSRRPAAADIEIEQAHAARSRSSCRAPRRMADARRGGAPLRHQRAVSADRRLSRDGGRPTQDLFESRACDGFILTPTVFPGMLEQFVARRRAGPTGARPVPARLRRPTLRQPCRTDRFKQRDSPSMSVGLGWATGPRPLAGGAPSPFAPGEPEDRRPHRTHVLPPRHCAVRRDEASSVKAGTIIEIASLRSQ